MALKWFRRNKDKKHKSDQIKDAQQADSDEIVDPEADAPISLEPEDQALGALQNAVDIPEDLTGEMAADPVEEDFQEPIDDAPDNQKKIGYFKRLKTYLSLRMSRSC